MAGPALHRPVGPCRSGGASPGRAVGCWAPRRPHLRPGASRWATSPRQATSQFVRLRSLNRPDEHVVHSRGTEVTSPAHPRKSADRRLPDGRNQPVRRQLPPSCWRFRQGRPPPMSQNTTQFSRLGIPYGGDGRTTFNLPNLAPLARPRRRSAAHPLRDPGACAYTPPEMEVRTQRQRATEDGPTIRGSAPGAHSHRSV